MRLWALVLLASVGVAEDEKKPAPDSASIQTATPDEPTPPEAPKSTIFNGVEVPPLKELSGEEFDKETKDGYWFVKHYSPYCHHCIAIAPTWQTLYEYYYVSHDSSMLIDGYIPI